MSGQRVVSYSRGPQRPNPMGRGLVMLCVITLLGSGAAVSQSAEGSSAGNPASIPAGAIAPLPPPPGAPEVVTTQGAVPAKQAREADDAYIEGAKQIERKNLAAAERSFARAVQLNPTNRDYALALIIARENHVSELVRSAAQARKAGDTVRADALLAEAQAVDPDNQVVAQHFGAVAPHLGDGSAMSQATLAALAKEPTFDPQKFPAQDIASTLSGPIELEPLGGKHSFHLRSDLQTVVRNVYSAYGITVTFDSSVTSGASIHLDLDDVSYEEATRIVGTMAHVFAVPVQAKSALVAKDTQEERERLMPLVEETVYLPGLSLAGGSPAGGSPAGGSPAGGTGGDEMTELANLARNVFDLRVTASATNGTMVLRGDEAVLREVTATFADLLDGGSDIMFDVNLYEVDKTHIQNIGATLPGGASAFPVASAAQNLIAQNQSLINQAIASGLIKLTGNSNEDALLELGVLLAANVSGASLFTNLIGVFGTYNKLPLGGLALTSSSSFNLLLNSTDTRMLDQIQLRGSNGQVTSFRAGTRYPIVTSTYTSGVSSSLASSLSGLNINGTSVSSLLSQYLGSSQVTVPVFQFEDLGITLKLTPHVLHGDEVQLAVDMKIEALAGSSIDSIPILNNRALTSTVTVPAGQTAMLATLVTRNEIGSIDGLPGISELPGFQGTDKDIEKDTSELLVTITPHIVRPGAFHVASRRLAAVKTSAAQ